MCATETFDYIVVGAGTAGCCIANRLSADGNKTVLLLEAGPPDRNPAIHTSLIPNIFGVWADENVSTSYPMQKTSRTGPRWPALLRGTVLGGSSSTNAMIHVRGDPRDFDNWARQGNSGWGYDDVLPHFKASESYDGAASPFRGDAGPVSVRKLPRPTRAAQAFLARTADLGFGGGEDTDLNEPPLEDKAGYFQFAINGDDTRCSSALAYLKPADQRANLQVRTGKRVIGLNVKRQRGGQRKVTGVSSLDLASGRARDINAQSEVILCAGAIGSPQLLMQSGIGPEDDLRRVGVKPLHVLPVGSNLQDHMIMVIRFESRSALPDPMFISEASLFVELAGGSRTSGSFDVKFGGWPNIQYFAHAGIAALKPPDTPDDYLVMAPTLVRPRSRGKLSLLSADPRVPASIEPNYLSSRIDVSVLAASLELTREIASDHPLVKKDGFSDLDKFESSNQGVANFVKQFSQELWHPAGTCKMAPPTDENAVVDTTLRVYGVDNLRVCDASVMPDIVAANPNPAILMIAERAAGLIG